MRSTRLPPPPPGVRAMDGDVVYSATSGAFSSSPALSPTRLALSSARLTNTSVSPPPEGAVEAFSRTFDRVARQSHDAGLVEGAYLLPRPLHDTSLKRSLAELDELVNPFRAEPHIGGRHPPLPATGSSPLGAGRSAMLLQSTVAPPSLLSYSGMAGRGYGGSGGLASPNLSSSLSSPTSSYPPQPLRLLADLPAYSSSAINSAAIAQSGPTSTMPDLFELMERARALTASVTAGGQLVGGAFGGGRGGVPYAVGGAGQGGGQSPLQYSRPPRPYGSSLSSSSSGSPGAKGAREFAPEELEEESDALRRVRMGLSAVGPLPFTPSPPSPPPSLPPSLQQPRSQAPAYSSPGGAAAQQQHQYVQQPAAAAAALNAVALSAADAAAPLVVSGPPLAVSRLNSVLEPLTSECQRLVRTLLTGCEFVLLLPAEAGGAGLATPELRRPLRGAAALGGAGSGRGGSTSSPLSFSAGAGGASQAMTNSSGSGARRRVRLVLQPDLRTVSWTAAGRLLEGSFAIPSLASIRVAGGGGAASGEGASEEGTRVVLSFKAAAPSPSSSSSSSSFAQQPEPLTLQGPDSVTVADWVAGLTLLHDILPTSLLVLA